LALTSGDGAISAARASFVSVTDVPDVLDLTEVLSGATAEDVAARADGVIEAVRAHVTPESDIHASADYRRMLAAELTRRLIAEVISR